MLFAHVQVMCYKVLTFAATILAPKFGNICHTHPMIMTFVAYGNSKATDAIFDIKNAIFYVKNQLLSLDVYLIRILEWNMPTWVKS